ncbi:TPA: broad-spectrum mercury transporter MerE [Escherichia coli]|nr:broad-spectrum mercury transporter MerE [Escherichia coli]
MNAPDKLPPETRQPVSGYLWGALAVLTCPCHLPILAAVLAGTTAGAFLGEHWGVAALALTGLFTYRKLKNQSIPLSTPYAT